jgi:hypothetical protein
MRCSDLTVNGEDANTARSGLLILSEAGALLYSYLNNQGLNPLARSSRASKEIEVADKQNSGTSPGRAEFELPCITTTITIHQVLFARSLAQTHSHRII